MGLVRGFRANNKSRIKRLHREGVDEISDDHLVIRLPDSMVLRVVSRSLLLALAIVSFPWLGSIAIRGASISYNAVSEAGIGADPINGELLSMLLRDLANEGLLKSADKALLVSRGGDNEVTAPGPQILYDNGIDLISEFDSERQSSIPDDTYDFAFAFGFRAGEFIDRTLKIGGIAAIQISDDPSDAFQKPSNYKIVYLRGFESTIVAMKKTGPGNISKNSPTKRRLCSLASEAKKAALNGLEDVLLEPPRAASVDTDKFLKKTKFLPDLMGDSLEGYPRRIFIDVGSPDKNNGSPRWFVQNYPTRNRDFEMYKIETVNEETPSETVPELGMSDWLKKNVKEEEYVVMKAEAEVVEEMVRSKAICLVDELFLECKHQGFGGRKSGSKRAYWECLSLYGRLRDEGVAVHQWWG